MPTDPTIAVRCPTCNGRLRIKDVRLRGQIVHCPRCQGLVLVQDDQEQLQVAVNEPADSQVETRDAIEPRPAAAEHTQSAVRSSVAQPLTQPPIVWERPVVKRRRQMILVSLIAGFMLLAVGVLFWLFVRSMMPTPTLAIAANANQAVAPLEKIDEASSNSPEPTKEPNAATKSQDLAPLPQEPIASVPVSETPTTTSSVPHAIEPAPDAVIANETQPSMLDLSPELKQFIPILSDRPPAIDPEMKLPTPMTAEELRLKLNLPVGSDNRLHPAPAPSIDVDPRLERKLAGFKPGSESLVELCGIISQMTGIPIWFDQAMLDTARIDLRRPVKIHPNATTVREALSSIVKAAGCIDVEEPAGMICIRAEDSVMMKHLTPALQVDDFDVNDPTWLAIVQKLVPIVQDLSIEDGGVAGRIVVDRASRQLVAEGDITMAQFWVAALTLEGLRASRTMPTRLNRAMTARWLLVEGPIGPTSIEEKLTSLDMDVALPMVDWVNRLAKEQGAIGLIQWNAAWNHGLTPTQTCLPFLRNNSVTKVLAQMLDPYDLRAFQDGPGVWWIGPEEAYQSRLTLAALKIPEGLRNRPTDLLNALAVSLKVAAQELPAAVDPQSGRLFLRMPRLLVAQVFANLDPIPR